MRLRRAPTVSAIFCRTWSTPFLTEIRVGSERPAWGRSCTSCAVSSEPRLHTSAAAHPMRSAAARVTEYKNRWLEELLVRIPRTSEYLRQELEQSLLHFALELLLRDRAQVHRDPRRRRGALHDYRKRHLPSIVRQPLEK